MILQATPKHLTRNFQQILQSHQLIALDQPHQHHLARRNSNDQPAILAIKINKLCCQTQQNSNKELEALQTTLGQLNLSIKPALIPDLQTINKQL